MDRKQHEMNARREFILETALGIFLEKGLRETTIEDIARASDYTRMSVYNHFKSREDICLQVFMKDYRRRSQRVLQKIKTVDDPLEKLRLWAWEYYAYSAEHPHIVELQTYLDYAGLNPERYSESVLTEYHELNLQLVDVLRGVLNHGLEIGILHQSVEIDTCINQFAYMLRAIIHRALSATYSFLEIEPDQYMEHFIDLFIRGLRRT